MYLFLNKLNIFTYERNICLLEGNWGLKVVKCKTKELNNMIWNDENDF